VPSSLDVSDAGAPRVPRLDAIREHDDTARRENFSIEEFECRQGARRQQRNPTPEQHRHQGHFHRVHEPGVEERTKQGAATEEPDIPPRLFLERRNDATGITQIIAGTGGAPLYQFSGSIANSAAQMRSYGLLKLTLQATSFDSVFLPVSGAPFDQYHGTCH